MSNTSQLRRYRINPVEIAIFSVVSLVFLNSVYNLFYDRQNFRQLVLNTRTEAPAKEAPAAQAAPSQAFLNLEVKCESAGEETTAASKVRLSGSLCDTGAGGRVPASDGGQLIKTQIINHANKFSATVFTDAGSAKFSTDYLPLNAGKNPIQLEFVYQGGKTVSHEVVINRN